MNSRRPAARAVPGLVAVLAAALLFASCGGEKTAPDGAETGPAAGKAESAPTATRPDDCPVARIGGVDIYYSDLARATAPDEARIAAADVSERRNLILRLREDTLRKLMVRETLRQEAESLGIRPTDDEVDDWIVARGPWGNSEAMGAVYPWLRGLTPEQFREAVRVDLAVDEAVRRSFQELAPVTDDEVRAYYEQNAERFRQPLRVKAYVIMVRKEGRTPEEARKKIDAIHDSLAADLGNAPSWNDKARILTEYARTYSEHESAERGGYWYVYPIGDNPDVMRFIEIAKHLPLQELSGVEELPSGYIVAAVEAVEGGDIPEFETARDKIRLLMLRERSALPRQQLYESLREKYHPVIVRENLVGCGAGES